MTSMNKILFTNYISYFCWIILICQCIFYSFFWKKRCTNSRFDTIFNKTQFCYDKEIAAKRSRTQKKRKSKELMMLLQYIIQNCWGFRKQNLRKNSRFHIYETKVRFKTLFYPTQKLLVQCTKCSYICTFVLYNNLSYEKP